MVVINRRCILLAVTWDQLGINQNGARKGAKPIDLDQSISAVVHGSTSAKRLVKLQATSFRPQAMLDSWSRIG